MAFFGVDRVFCMLIEHAFLCLKCIKRFKLDFGFFFGTKRQTKNNFRGAGLGFFLENRNRYRKVEYFKQRLN